MSALDGWRGLLPRERRVLGGGTLVLLAALLYVGVWEPLATRHAFLAGQIDGQVRVLAELETIAARAATLAPQPAGPHTALSSGQAPIAFVNASAAEHGLAPYLRRTLPRDDGVTVTLAEAPFDELVSWLVALQGGHGVAADRVMLSRVVTKPGTVTGNLNLVFGR
ncbi:MAG: type II secretion system protein GspM [Gammaproteobacteria bacterium]